ncbi:MAG TPA: hypothetical protein VGA13_01545 [Acidimicrobiales bacterium]
MNLQSPQGTALVAAAGVIVGLAVGIPLGIGLDVDPVERSGVVATGPDDETGEQSDPDDESRPAATGEPRQVLSIDGLEGPARELVELLRSGAETTFYGRWESDVMRGDEPQIVMEIWNSPPNVRRDNVLRSEGSEIQTSEYDTGGDVIVRCARFDTDWQCAPSPYESGTPVPGDLSLGAIGEDLGDREVRVRDAEIDGRAARCFEITEDRGTFDLCVSTSGIPLLIDSPEAELRLVLLENDVDSSVFVPPGAALNG